MLLTIFLFGLAITFILVYIIGKNNERYWKKRGVKFATDNPLTGPFWEFATQRRPLFEVFGDIYRKYNNEPAVGIGAFVTPTLYVIDPKNVQHVLQGDFNSFYHRGLEGLENDLLSNNILFLNGPKWKLLRQSMSPLFTSTKLKSMYYIMDKSAHDFVQYLKENPKSQEGNCFDTLAVFSNAAVAATIFGINQNSIFDTPFLEMARKAAAPSLSTSFKFTVMNLSPELAKFIGFSLFEKYENFFVNAIRQVIKIREQENVRKHDFADICISIQKNGIMRDQATGCEIEPTVEVLAAQAFFFFIAGVEPCASAMFATLIQLGRHPEILDKVHEEIDFCFDKYDSKITYDVITEMEYIHKVVNEAMRIFPPLSILSRKCVKDTVLPVGNIKVDKGTKVFTPIIDIHHDPKIYPKPEEFDPERFSTKNDEVYFPFGSGNRKCIGARYATLQMISGLVHVLRHFAVKTIPESGDITYRFDLINVRPNNVDVKLIPRNVTV